MQALRHRSIESLSTIIAHLELAVEQSDFYIDARQQRIDSIAALLRDGSTYDFSLAEQLGQLYSAFNNDSALVTFHRAASRAQDMGLDSLARRFIIYRSALLPLAGAIGEAVHLYTSLPVDSLSVADRILYYTSGRQMYSYISSMSRLFPESSLYYDSLASQAQRQLIELLPPHSPEFLLHKGESEYIRGNYVMSEALLGELLRIVPSHSNQYAIACHILSEVAKARGDSLLSVNYLCLSAISDVRGATREVTSLQELGQIMFECGNVARAHLYLYMALSNAVECNVANRMIQISKTLPILERVHKEELRSSRLRIYIVIGLLSLAVVVMVVLLILLQRKVREKHLIQLHFEHANHTKEVYMSQFLNLCSIYMEKLKQFCSIANRKISAGKAEELYRLTKSGKFIENQSAEFYQIFDNAFIHIYPGFVDSVNRLLRPEERIELPPGQLLNTDLRILACLRLGIDECGRIAQILNYSVNTIYTYRNKMKNRAIDRDTFEASVMAIGG